MVENIENCIFPPLYDLRSDASFFQRLNPKDVESCPRSRTKHSFHLTIGQHHLQNENVRKDVSEENRSWYLHPGSISRQSKFYL